MLAVYNSPRARNRFNQVVEAKRFEGVFYVEKCAQFKNQTLKKRLCATEYPEIALKWGYPCRLILLTMLYQ